MAKEWYLKIDNKTFGPYGVRQIKMMANKNHIDTSTLIKKTNAGKWVSITLVKGLFETSKGEESAGVNNSEALVELPDENTIGTDEEEGVKSSFEDVAASNNSESVVELPDENIIGTGEEKNVKSLYLIWNFFSYMFLIIYLPLTIAFILSPDNAYQGKEKPTVIEFVPILAVLVCIFCYCATFNLALVTIFYFPENTSKNDKITKFIYMTIIRVKNFPFLLLGRVGQFLVIPKKQIDAIKEIIVTQNEDVQPQTFTDWYVTRFVGNVSGFGRILLVIFVAVFGIFMMPFIYLLGFLFNCPKCKKVWVRKIINQEYLKSNQGAMTITRSDLVYSEIGEKKLIKTIARQEQVVTTNDFYDVTYVCISCNNQWKKIEVITYVK